MIWWTRMNSWGAVCHWKCTFCNRTWISSRQIVVTWATEHDERFHEDISVMEQREMECCHVRWLLLDGEKGCSWNNTRDRPKGDTVKTTHWAPLEITSVHLACGHCRVERLKGNPDSIWLHASLHYACFNPLHSGSHLSVARMLRGWNRVMLFQYGG